ncbi:alcohol dehydrogenase GroES-like domain-containing protein [Colletotrichum acutatum]|uniref:Alcohol dehydrogenase GroES-like domain-containing protein n=1 Tax=Glomerella acutata TaxID=27357 RepID=A0AAD8XBQ0_GLOAC|nr:alcohol dehydrogenase GroES-like domain-containing protein [Colletotrichum acutatum]KAK1716007.1 alcohol dehydrogenase GroES-like domain-containing protein [Colletotrichum acutatum]
MTNHQTSRPKTMRAVVWEGKPYEMAVKADIPLPHLKEPEDAIVRITTSAICGTDLHIYHGIMSSAEVPYPVGHEAMGIVEEVGDAVDNLQVGDRVVVFGLPEDGVIDTDNQIFPQLDGFGLGKDFGDLGGLQAEYVRVPFADSSLIKIPKKLSDKEWLFLSDIFPTAWEGLSWSGFQPGDSVAVFGGGPVGLLCAYSAIIRGASLVYVVDHIPQRLAKAASIGAVPINFTKGGASASEQILALRPGGVNRSVDCCGQECVNAELKPQQDYILREAIAVTAVGGGIGIPGVYWAQEKSAGAPNAEKMKKSLSLPISDFWIKALTMKSGIVQGQPTFAALVKLVESGQARPGFIATAEYDLDDAPKAYKRFDKRLEVKVLFRGAGKEGRDDYEWDEEVESKNQRQERAGSR